MSVMTCNSYDGRRICTYTPKKDTCRGDSGGPVIWLDPDVNRYIFVAVVSYGPAECGNSDGRPGVNTNVSYYLQ
ncbi:trypsin-like serine protease, partial [Halalkalibacter flavus]|uniref:trypsin-like serine protease n=1 Tax=Halalkalibacter flavus TaxID=3090668 RepID=UPI003D66DB73